MKSKFSALALLLFFATNVTAQVTWKTYGTFKDPTLSFTTDNANLIVAVTGTTNKTWIAKNKFTGFSVRIDTVKVVLDPKNSADYQNLAATLAQTIEQRDEANRTVDKLMEANAELRIRHSQLIQVARELKAEINKYRQVIIWVPKNDSL